MIFILLLVLCEGRKAIFCGSNTCVQQRKLSVFRKIEKFQNKFVCRKSGFKESTSFEDLARNLKPETSRTWSNTSTSLQTWTHITYSLLVNIFFKKGQMLVPIELSSNNPLDSLGFTLIYCKYYWQHEIPIGCFKEITRWFIGAA